MSKDGSKQSRRRQHQAAPCAAGATAFAQNGASPAPKGSKATQPSERRKSFDGLPTLKRDVAGIDIGSTEHYVSVPEDRDSIPIRTFGCFTPELTKMAQWLQQCGVRSVVMESTGVYWIPVYQVLQDSGFEVVLVDAHAVQGAPGRQKTDVHDCLWLRKVYSCGMVRACFIPPNAVLEMRTYWRQRGMLVQELSRQVLRMHKALEQMNLQLHKVLSDVSGVTGMRIIRAVLAGERDPVVLARLKHPQVKSSEETIAQALTGHFRPEHLFALEQAVATYDFLLEQIHQCDRQLEACLERFSPRTPPTMPGTLQADEPALQRVEDEAEEAATAKAAQRSEIPAAVVQRGKRRHCRSKTEPRIDLRRHLIHLTGVDLTTIDGISVHTAQTIVSECGPDLSAFPTEDQFASWMGLCPNRRITGGKVRSSATRKVTNRAASALRVAAQSLHHSDSALGAYYRRMRARLGAASAITATAHRLARLIYRMIRYGQEYVDRGQQWYEARYQETVRQRLLKQARKLGLRLVCPSTGEIVS